MSSETDNKPQTATVDGDNVVIEKQVKTMRDRLFEMIGANNPAIPVHETQEGQATKVKKNKQILVGNEYKAKRFVLSSFFSDFLFKGNENYRISSKVLERLLLRHSILSVIEEIESNYKTNKEYIPKAKQVLAQDFLNFARPERVDSVDTKNNSVNIDEKDKGTKDGGEASTSGELAGRLRNLFGKKAHAPSDGEKFNLDKFLYSEYSFDIKSESNVRSYRLATTDLFVEKAIAYLEEDYNKYIRHGLSLFTLAFFLLSFGIYYSYERFISSAKIAGSADLKSGLTIYELIHGKQIFTYELVSVFVAGFTFYGFIVLFAVSCMRLGKAMMDQAERLRERRHSLRQGRLYIHLSNGEVTIEELEKAFDWNVSKGNAFANIPTEASAPWGGVIKEALKTLPEIFKRAKT